MYSMAAEIVNGDSEMARIPGTRAYLRWQPIRGKQWQGPISRRWLGWRLGSPVGSKLGNSPPRQICISRFVQL
jgi:hypothetical protein